MLLNCGFYCREPSRKKFIVTVEPHDPFSPGFGKACSSSAPLTPVDLIDDQLEPGIGEEGSHRRDRTVRGSVVNNNDFELLIDLAQAALQSPADFAFPIEKRYNDAEPAAIHL